ncbi:MAG TPA: hypothetical protein VLH79_09075 [Chthonomonadales bacterium]|nr:hypothetical protein [Chthonomonadales bacterium]
MLRRGPQPPPSVAGRGAYPQRPYWLRLGDLPATPYTPKEHFRASPREMLARPASRQGRLRRYLTSGSTGSPVTAYCTADDHRRFIAAREARSFGWAGASVRAPRSMIGGRMVVPRAMSQPPYHRVNWAERQIYMSAYHLSPAAAGAYVDALNRHRPEVLTGYAHSHFTLAMFMLQQGLSLQYRPTALILSSALRCSAGQPRLVTGE